MRFTRPRAPRPRDARSDASSPLVISISVFRRASVRLRASFKRAVPPSAASARGRVAVLAALVALVSAGACTEQLDSGPTCGTSAAATGLCPLANEQLRDTVIDPVALDTTLSGFPLFGSTRPLLVAAAPAPDSLDVRAVIRFDSIPAKYGPAAGGDSVAITTVDSTYLRLQLDTTALAPTAAVTLEAYDVDTPTGTDTTTATLAALFTPSRRLGSVGLPAATRYPDSLRLKLSDSAFADKARNGRRLRIGLRVVSAARAQLRVAGVRSGTTLASSAPTLLFDAATDTGYKAVIVNPASTTPSGDAIAAGAAIDQSLVVVSPRAAAGSDLIVGGVPARRSFIRFNIPIRLSDSTDVVRAVLELTQRPAPYAGATDTVRIRSEAVLATTAVTDLVQAALLAAPAEFSADTLTLSPADSGTRTLSLVTLVRAFRSLPANTMRAIALRSTLEGAQAGEVRFFSSKAAAAVRPRLRLTYIPRSSFGVP